MSSVAISSGPDAPEDPKDREYLPTSGPRSTRLSASKLKRSTVKALHRAADSKHNKAEAKSNLGRRTKRFRKLADETRGRRGTGRSRLSREKGAPSPEETQVLVVARPRRAAVKVESSASDAAESLKAKKEAVDAVRAEQSQNKDHKGTFLIKFMT